MSKRPAPEQGSDANGAKVPKIENLSNGVTQFQLPEFKPPPKDIPTLHYKEGRLSRDFVAFFNSNKTSLLVVIAPEYMVGVSKLVKQRQLWGQDTYTDDSDLVAVLLHLGYYASNNIAANPLVSRFYAQVQLLPKQPFYASATRNSVRSRCWYSDTPGCAYQVERCWLVTRTNKQIELQKRSDESLLNQPTYALSNADRQISTRAAAGSSRNKPTSEVTVLYNLVNEPWLKYSMSAVADRGLKSSHYTSARLRDEVLYLETSTTRYELSWCATDDVSQPARYKFARVKQPLPIAAMTARGMPLPGDDVEVLEDGLAWEDIVWANMSMAVRGTHHRMLRLQFLTACKPGGSAP